MTVCPECRDLVPECRARAEALRDAAIRWEARIAEATHGGRVFVLDVPAFLRSEAEREEIDDPRLRRAEMVDAFARTSDAHAAYLVALRAEVARTRAALSELVAAITAPEAFPVETSDAGARLLENPRITAAIRRAGRV